MSGDVQAKERRQMTHAPDLQADSGNPAGSGRRSQAARPTRDATGRWARRRLICECNLLILLGERAKRPPRDPAGSRPAHGAAFCQPIGQTASFLLDLECTRTSYTHCTHRLIAGSDLRGDFMKRTVAVIFSAVASAFVASSASA